MGYFDSPENVEAYLEMVEGYDGRPLVQTLLQWVPAGATVLELGMGGGGDLALMAEAGLQPTGSDASQVFVDRYRRRDGRCPVLVLDATTIDTSERYDAIFTNKVLQHLTTEQLRRSLARQAEVLASGGVAFHALWYGTDTQTHEGMRFVQYTLQTLRPLLPPTLAVAGSERYDEMAPGDSMWVALRRVD